MTAPPVLEVMDLSVQLGGKRVLENINLRVEPGWTCIVGPNGAGKSTLLRAMAALVPAHTGRIRLQGRSLELWPGAQRARTLAWLAQREESSGDLGVREVVMLGRVPHLGLFGAPTRRDEEAVDAAMQAAECAAWPHRRLLELSGGERQRVLLARALAVESPVLLLDEPTTHLDPPHQVALVRLLRLLGRDRTVLSVMHDLPLALQADRVVVMDQGQVVAQGSPSEASLCAAVERVFNASVRVQRLDGRVVVLPDLG